MMQDIDDIVKRANDRWSKAVEGVPVEDLKPSTNNLSDIEALVLSRRYKDDPVYRGVILDLIKEVKYLRKKLYEAGNSPS